MCSPRCFFFRRQPPCQILQRKKANESETARVPKQKGSENVCDTRHSLLCRALQCASITSNFSRSGMKDEDTRTCLSPYKGSTKGAAHSAILLSRLRFLFHSLLYLRGSSWKEKIVVSETPAHHRHVIVEWAKSIPGASGISFERALCQGKASLTHEHFQPTTPSTSPYSAHTN